MTTLNLQVEASNEDAREDTFLETASITGINIYAQNTWVWVGQLFLDVTIPQGASIISAILSLYMYQVSGTRDDAHFDSHCDDTDDSAVYVAVGGTISDRDETSAYADVDEDDCGGPGWYEITMTGPVQEVVNRALFVSGNAVGTFQKPTAGIDWQIWAWDGDSAKAPKLDIDYSAVAVVVPVIMDTYRRRRVG